MVTWGNKDRRAETSPVTWGLNDRKGKPTKINGEVFDDAIGVAVAEPPPVVDDAVFQGLAPSPTPSFNLQPPGAVVPPIELAQPEVQRGQFFQSTPPATGQMQDVRIDISPKAGAEGPLDPTGMIDAFDAMKPGIAPSQPPSFNLEPPGDVGPPAELRTAYPQVDPAILKQVEAALAGPAPVEPTRDIRIDISPKAPGLWDQTKKAWERSGQNIELDFLWHKVAMGELDEKEARQKQGEFDKISKADPIKGRHWAQNLFLQTVGVARPMAEGAVEGAAVGTAAGGTAAVAGQLGPQAAFPEEIVTVPGAFAAGQVAGSVNYWSQQGSGEIYQQARKKGVSQKAASYAAAAGGPLYAFIEYSQVDKLIPGIGKFKGKLLNKAIQIGANTAKEIGEEGVQRVVTDGAVNMARVIEGDIKAADVPAEAKTMALNALNEMKEAAGPLAVLGLGSATVSAGLDIATEQQQQAKIGERQGDIEALQGEARQRTKEGVETTAAQTQAVLGRIREMRAEIAEMEKKKGLFTEEEVSEIADLKAAIAGIEPTDAELQGAFAQAQQGGIGDLGVSHDIQDEIERRAEPTFTARPERRVPVDLREAGAAAPVPGAETQVVLPERQAVTARQTPVSGREPAPPPQAVVEPVAEQPPTTEPGAVPEAEAEAPAAEEPWEISQAQYAQDQWQGVIRRFKDRPDILDAKDRAEEIEHFKELHAGEVSRAIEQGKPVPAAVLAEYPDLRKPTPAPTKKERIAERNLASWKAQLLPKMREMGIKDFSDSELRRVFKDTVAEDNNIEMSKLLIEQGRLKLEEVSQPTPKATEGKQPWEMTKEEFDYWKRHDEKTGRTLSSDALNTYISRKQTVINALEDKHPVPAEVLAEYPDLRKPAPEAEGKVVQGVKQSQQEIEGLIEDTLNDNIAQGWADYRITGSRTTGTHKPGSDVDVFVQYTGELSEDKASELLNRDRPELETTEGEFIEIDFIAIKGTLPSPQPAAGRASELLGRAKPRVLQSTGTFAEENPDAGPVAVLQNRKKGYITVDNAADAALLMKQGFAVKFVDSDWKGPGISAVDYRHPEDGDYQTALNEAEEKELESQGYERVEPAPMAATARTGITEPSKEESRTPLIRAYRGDIEERELKVHIPEPADLAGIYLSTDKKTAQDFAKMGIEGQPEEGGLVREFDVNLQNPASEAIEQQVLKELDAPTEEDTDFRVYTPELAEDVAAELQRRGYDGVIREGSDEIIVFDPAKIAQPAPKAAEKKDQAVWEKRKLVLRNREAKKIRQNEIYKLGIEGQKRQKEIFGYSKVRFPKEFQGEIDKAIGDFPHLQFKISTKPAFSGKHYDEALEEIGDPFMDVGEFLQRMGEATKTPKTGALNSAALEFMATSNDPDAVISAAKFEMLFGTDMTAEQINNSIREFASEWPEISEEAIQSYFVEAKDVGKGKKRVRKEVPGTPAESKGPPKEPRDRPGVTINKTLTGETVEDVAGMGEQTEMFDKGKFRTIAEQDRINAKGDVEGQGTFFDKKKPALVTKTLEEQGEMTKMEWLEWAAKNHPDPAVRKLGEGEGRIIKNSKRYDALSPEYDKILDAQEKPAGKKTTLGAINKWEKREQDKAGSAGWDLSVIRNTRKHYVTIQRTLGRNPWQSIQQIGKEKQSWLRSMAKENMLQVMWDKTGTPFYANLEEPSNPDLLTEKQIDEVEKKPPGGAAGSSVAAAAGPGRGYGTIAAQEKNKFAKTTNRTKFREAAPTKSEFKPADELLKMVAPGVRSGARGGTRVLRKQLGRLSQETVVAHEALAKAHHAFTFMSRPDIYEFLDRMETGKQQASPQLQGIADQFRKLLDERRDAVRKLGKGHLSNFYENYFPHIWKDPVHAKGIIARIMGKRPFEGSKAFLKKRTLVTIKDGREAGLELVSENPVDLALLKIFEMDRYLMAQRTIQEMKGRGLIRLVYSRTKAPDGYQKVEDNAFTVYMPPEITKPEAYDQLLVDQMTDIARSLGIDAQRFTSIGGRRWGFAQEPQKVRTKYAGPESVLAHEIGHVLGFKYHLYDVLGQRKEGVWKVHKSGKKKGEKYFSHAKSAVEHRRTIDKEWRGLADARFKSVGASPGYTKYVRKAAEKEAVLLEALIHAPEEFKSVAPTLHDLFVKFLNAHSELRPILDIKPSLVLGQSEATIKIPGFTTLGHYYAVEPVAKILNNYLSPGLRNNKNKLIAGGYNLARMSGNLLNQAQLALSGFHGLNVTTDMIASTLGLGVRQLSVPGQRFQGLGHIATAGVSPIARIWEGTRLRKAYKQQIESIEDPKLRTMVEAIVLAGGRDRMDPFYYNQAIKALKTTIGDIMHGAPTEKLVGTAKLPFQTFGATLELAAKPLMEWYVPTGKLGLFSMMAQHEMERAEAGQITDEQLHERLISSWDSVDNRMGQLVYDNLFWNKTFKDVAMMAVRSVGWNLGSWREYGGVPIDILQTTARIQRGDVWLSQKMAYTIGAITLYGTLGAVIMYLLTGEPPEEPKDYFFPKTGKKNPDGSDERLSLPTYAKDWFAYGTQPTQTVKNKLHPLWGLLTDVTKNKDFFNVQIRDPKDALSQQMLDVGEYIGKEFLPLSGRNYQKMARTDPGQTGKNLWVSVSGITSAPAYISRSPAQKLMYRYIVENIPDKEKTKEEGAKAAYRREVKNRLRKGDPVDQQEAIEKLGRLSWNRLKIDAGKEPFAESFGRLSLTQALNVYVVADAKERGQAKIILVGKYSGATKKTPEITKLYKEALKR